MEEEINVCHKVSLVLVLTNDHSHLQPYCVTRTTHCNCAVDFHQDLRNTYGTAIALTRVRAHANIYHQNVESRAEFEVKQRNPEKDTN
jgi:hypothetical protein